MSTLAEIRAKLLEAEQNSAMPSGPSLLYPHWNMQFGSTIVLRFLPDANPNNIYFWEEMQVIKLPFAGISTDTTSNSKEVIVSVPCMETWNEVCPVLSEVRPWYKDPSLKKIAGIYWKKRSYNFQGFVRETGIEEVEVPENPIRRFLMGPQLFKIIKQAILDPELEELPTDYSRGLDFRIYKTKNGEQSDYGTSVWARRESSLNDMERQAIETYGLHDISTFMMKKPSPHELAIITEMFEASVDGKPYDVEKWGQFYRPKGLVLGQGDETSEDSDTEGEHTENTKSNVDNIVPLKHEEPTPIKSAKANDILKMIKEKNAKS